MKTQISADLLDLPVVHVQHGAGGLDLRALYERYLDDTGFRHRCWQGTGRNAAGRYTWAARPAVRQLARRNLEAQPGAVA